MSFASCTVKHLRMQMRLGSLCAFAALTAAFAGFASTSVAQEAAQDTAQDTASTSRPIALDYPGDVGIEKDTRVVFAENFEEGDLEAIGRRWEMVRSEKR